MGPQKVVDRLQEKGFKVKGNDLRITIAVPDLDFKALYKLKEKLKETIVSGVKGVSQVVVAMRGKDYVVLTAGSDLGDVRQVKGVNPDKVTSNDLHDTANVLGIEAARQTIIDEIKGVLSSQGLDINERHLKLIADAMTSSVFLPEQHSKRQISNS